MKWIDKQLIEIEKLVLEGNLRDAEIKINDLLYDEPGCSKLHNMAGWLYLYHLNDIVRAEVHLYYAVRFDTLHAPAYLHLGILHLRKNNLVDALGYLEQGMLKADAYLPAFLENIGMVYELRGEWRKALRSYRKAMLHTVHADEMRSLSESIKRCRRKRLMLFGL